MRFRTPRRILCGLSLMTSLLLTLTIMLYPDTFTTAVPTILREDNGNGDISRSNGGGGGGGGGPGGGSKVGGGGGKPAIPRVKTNALKDKGKARENSWVRAFSSPAHDPPAVEEAVSKEQQKEDPGFDSQKDPPRLVAQIPEAMRKPPVPQESPDTTKSKNGDDLWNLLMSETLKPLPKNRINGPQRPFNCTPKHHIFFGKVHKTGSSTVSNILQRYGFSRRLNFVSPRKRIHSRSYNYISTPGEAKVSRNRLIPPPVGEHYDILWNHALYNSEFYHSIMPNDTVFVTILRQPLQQFQSSFEYYGRAPGSFLHTMMRKNVSNPMSLFLHNASAFHMHQYMDSYLSYIRNKQAQDLGMKRVHAVNATARRNYIERLGREFTLVMLTEFFDVSLVMLRRLMCWEVRDVLYMPMNANPFKRKHAWTSQDVARHRQLNVLDYELYEFFLERFKNNVARASQDFRDEVAHFKGLLATVRKYCSSITPNSAWLHLKPSRWSDPIDLEPEDCLLMQKHELLFLDDIMVDAIRRYQKSVGTALKHKP